MKEWLVAAGSGTASGIGRDRLAALSGGGRLRGFRRPGLRRGSCAVWAVGCVRPAGSVVPTCLQESAGGMKALVRIEGKRVGK